MFDGVKNPSLFISVMVERYVLIVSSCQRLKYICIVCLCILTEVQRACVVAILHLKKKAYLHNNQNKSTAITRGLLCLLFGYFFSS